MDLNGELKQHSKIFNNYWQQFIRQGEPFTLYDAARHLPLSGGKRLRPFLAIVSCESVSGKIETVLPFAAALELMHNFTLVHDDIMDKSKLRRNVPTVHVKFSEPTAILSGDFLFAKSFEAMHHLDVDSEIYKELDFRLVQCIIDICEGQQFDMEFEKRSIVSEEEYIKMITKKTAVLFILAAAGGAMIGSGTDDEINALADYGLFLGLAFQIWDDYLDISSDEEILGKDIGNDIRNGKKTLIAVHCLKNATEEDKKFLNSVFGNKHASEEDIKKVFNLFKKLGSIEYAKNLAIAYNKKAKEIIQILKESKSRKLLEALADYSIQRVK